MARFVSVAQMPTLAENWKGQLGTSNCIHFQNLSKSLEYVSWYLQVPRDNSSSGFPDEVALSLQSCCTEFFWKKERYHKALFPGQVPGREDEERSVSGDVLR